MRGATRGGRGYGRLSRISLWVRSLTGVVLALGIAVLAVDLSDWKYWRHDFSLSGRNTLDPAVADLIGRLPQPVVIDVFYRPLLEPYASISATVVGRFAEVARVAVESHRDKLELRVHDPADLEETQARQQELGVNGVNFVLFSTADGARKSRAELYGEVAVVDWGNPSFDGANYLEGQGIRGAVGPNWRPNAFQPARLSSFRGVEVLATALLKVSTDSTPHVYFTTGSGEPSLTGSDSGDLTRLVEALRDDGFAVDGWNPSEAPDVPEDCTILASVGPTQPYPEGTTERIRAWIEAGGSFLGAPDASALEAGLEGSVGDLLASYGMIPQAGVVCEPLRGAGGEEVEGDYRCAVLNITNEGLSASSPLTAPLRDRGRRLDFLLTPSLRRGGLEGGAPLLDVVTSSNRAWLDRPAGPGQYDFMRSRDEVSGRQALVMEARLTTGRTLPSGEVRRGRVLGIASSGFLSNGLHDTNRDFLLNAFNTMDASRQWRIRVSPLPRPESHLDLERGTALHRLGLLAYGALPALAALTGLVLVYRRRG